MYKIVITKKADKEFAKIVKGDRAGALYIGAVLEVLSSCDNPIKLNNAKKLQGQKRELWRWKAREYRIIGEIENKILTITIIKIATRQSAYKDF